MATLVSIPEVVTPIPLPAAEPQRLQDRFGRVMTDLRVSITDRCNYRCVYCRTGTDGAAFAELGIEAYAAMIRLLVGLGIEKVRLTGGEPLLRRGLLDLVREVRSMPLAFPGDRDNGVEIALTTNGHLLAGMARDLKEAGLDRITVSMDAVTPDAFERITRIPNSLGRVLDGIHAAQDAGLGSIKVNCVLMRGWNDDQIEAFGDFARREQVILRFIEFMPLDEERIWAADTVVREAEIVERLSRVSPVRLLPPNHPSETARRYQFLDGSAELGIIAPVSRPFCGHCSRLRLTSDGKLRTCLFSQTDHDLHGRMLRGASTSEMREYVRSVVLGKEERHHIGEAGFLKPSRSMVHIGG
ncbi:GTP 3',8-cyclase MoaA [Terriglobus aquaticus]|uniref:GTP 3',8-cyclase n=1 Tax=Terriglobus aquaticus TaxID=940139 RepID=A0ABW9KHU8_9BACT